MDKINPEHYKKGWIEPIDFITSNNLDFCEWNVVKYVSRWRFKNGLEDLEKSKYYIEKLIEKEKAKR